MTTAKICIVRGVRNGRQFAANNKWRHSFQVLAGVFVAPMAIVLMLLATIKVDTLRKGNKSEIQLDVCCASGCNLGAFNSNQRALCKIKRRIWLILVVIVVVVGRSRKPVDDHTDRARPAIGRRDIRKTTTLSPDSILSSWWWLWWLSSLALASAKQLA